METIKPPFAVLYGDMTDEITRMEAQTEGAGKPPPLISKVKQLNGTYLLVVPKHESRVVIGRVPRQVDIPLEDCAQVSRQHAAISFSKGSKRTMLIEDLESKFGTLLKVPQEGTLVPKRGGLTVSVGGSTFHIQCNTRK